jgi:hypothetical protein
MNELSYSLDSWQLTFEVPRIRHYNRSCLFKVIKRGGHGGSKERVVLTGVSTYSSITSASDVIHMTYT